MAGEKRKKWDYCLVFFDETKMKSCSIFFPKDMTTSSAVGATFAEEEEWSGITKGKGWKWNPFGISRPETEALSKLISISGSGLLIDTFSILGEQGWELVAQENGQAFYFKRLQLEP